MRLRLGWAACVAVASLAWAGEAPTTRAASGFADGQRVDVRDGEAWTPATVVRREGRRYLIRREGADSSKDAWVAADQLLPRATAGPGKRPETIHPRSRARSHPPDKPGTPFGPKLDTFTRDPNYTILDDTVGPDVDEGSAIPPGLKFAPDAARTQDVAGRAIPFAALTGHPRSVIVPRGGNGTVAYVELERASDLPRRLQRIDLAAGAAGAAVDIEPGVEVLDVSADGKTILCRNAADSRIAKWGREHAIVYRVDDGAPARREIVFSPQIDDRINASTEAGWIVDADHVITHNAGRITMWDLRAKRSAWSGALARDGKPAMSANRKYVAIPQFREVNVVEAATGNLVARWEDVPDDVGGTLAFSPDGAKVLMLYKGTIWSWDVASGRVAEFTTSRGLAGQAKIEVVGNGHLLAGDRFLVDVEKRALLWMYDMRLSVGAAAPDGTYCYVVHEVAAGAPRPEGGATLVTVRLPHSEALAAAKAIDAEQTMAIKPGARVKVDVAALRPPDQPLIRGALTRRFAEHGWVVDDASTVKLTITSDPAKAYEQTYRARDGSEQRVQVIPRSVQVVLMVDGSSAWSTGYYGAAFGTVELPKGQTPEMLAEALSRPSAEFFETMWLPTYLARPRTPPIYGKSVLGLKGVESDGR